MSTTAELSQTRSWMDTGTALFTATVDRLTDSDLAAASQLPGWSRRHVVAHVALNAQALRRLVRWARTGKPTLMYASAEQRVSDIEEAAAWPPGRLRSFLADTAVQLATDLDRLPPGRLGRRGADRTGADHQREGNPVAAGARGSGARGRSHRGPGLRGSAGRIVRCHRHRRRPPSLIAGP